MEKECKDCKKVFQVVELIKGKRKYHKSLDGKWWNFSTCPACRKAYMKNWNQLRGIKKRTVNRNRHLDSVLLAPGVSLKPCPGCKTPTVNRFFCGKCLYEKIGAVGTHNDDFIYFGD